MPRPPRFYLADCPQHIVQRGHNGADCFFADDDYRFYLRSLKQGAEKYGCAIHAYVVMPNHAHLLLTPQQPDAVSRLMQSLGRRYAQHLNSSYQRNGTVWEPRFKANLIQPEAYLLTCYRYIELNPVRAGMVGDPGEYAWSSYMHNGLGHADPLLREHPLYVALGSTESKQQAAYRELLREPLDEAALTAIREAVNRGQPLGADDFREQVEIASGRGVLERKANSLKVKERAWRDGSSELTGERQERGL